MTLPTEQYRNTQVMTASPMGLVIMLYDECVRSLKQAEEAFTVQTETQFQDINNNLLHAQDIITELAVSLDMEKGGEVAGSLQRLYEFMAFHLGKANTSKSAAPIREVREMMIELRDAWRNVAEQEPSYETDAQSGDLLSNTLAKG